MTASPTAFDCRWRDRGDPDRFDRLRPVGWRAYSGTHRQRVHHCSIAPHALTMRPIVVADDSVIRITHVPAKRGQYRWSPQHAAG